MYYKVGTELYLKLITFLTGLQVYDSNMAVSAVDDYNTSTRSLAAAALRNILGTRNLGEILSERLEVDTITAGLIAMAGTP